MVNTLFLPELREMLAENNAFELREFCTALHPARTSEFMEGLDAADPLAHYAKAFVQPDEDLIYLDGNSLGMLPLSARDRLHEFVDHEWGQKLVRGWDEWISMPLEVGDRLGGLIGAAAGQVVVCDSISVNIYKLAVAALEAQPGRKVLVTDAAGAAKLARIRAELPDLTTVFVVEGDRVAADNRLFYDDIGRASDTFEPAVTRPAASTITRRIGAPR